MRARRRNWNEEDSNPCEGAAGFTKQNDKTSVYCPSARIDRVRKRGLKGHRWHAVCVYPNFSRSHLLVAGPAGLVSVDVQRTCRAAADAMTELMAGSTVQRDVDVCMNSEQAAREQII